MRITFDEWKEIHKKASDAIKALTQLDNTLGEIALKHESPERQLFVNIMSQLGDARQLCRSVQIQSEWLGGDSTDPNNFGWREPNCISIPHTLPNTAGKTLD